MPMLNQSKTSDESPILLPVDEAAKLLGFSVHSLNGWRARRVGPPFYKVMGKVMYDRAELQTWLRAMAVTPVESSCGGGR